jgi:putative glutamine amidotransferase
MLRIKKTVFIIIAFLSSIIVFAENSDSIIDENYDFAITRPTVTNLERIIYLIDNEFIQIPNVSILAIYYDLENYNYDKSRLFLKNYEGDINIELKEINGVLTSENIYNKNSLSSVFQDVVSHTNGILFFGGDDLPPYTYNEKMDLRTEVYDTYRHFFELSFLFQLLGGSQNESVDPILTHKNKYLIWTFCLGTQTMNVATGGTLIQDIPSEVYNMKYVEDVIMMPDNQIHKNYNRVLFPEKEFPGSKLHQIFIPDSSELNLFVSDNSSPYICSYHHQCIGELGENLIPIAYSVDMKITEAVKHNKFSNVLGLQFHPERLELYDQSKKMYHSPNDSVPLSYYDILQQNNSYQFHVNIWKGFSKTFVNFRKLK